MTLDKAAIYARVSSERQAQAKTIESQLEHVNEYVASKGIRVDADFIFIDNGVSGSSLIRPGLDALRDMASVGKINQIFVLSPDRLARKHAHQLILLEEFERLDTKVVFVNRDVSSNTAEDQMLLQIQGVISEYEREKIMERHRRGKLHKAKHGSVNVFSGAPYGYVYIKKTPTNEASFLIHLDEAKVVKKIYDLYVNKFFSVPKIAKYLDDQNIPTARGLGGWSSRTIWGILKNPAYTGLAAYGKTKATKSKRRYKQARTSNRYSKSVNSSAERTPKDKWINIPVPALISETLFNQVPIRAAENKAKSKRNRKREHLLSGLGYCTECGYTIYGCTNRGAKERYYYRCYGQDAWKNNQYKCTSKTIRAEVLDDLVWEQTRKLIETPEQVFLEYSERLGKKENHHLSIEKVITRKRQDICTLVREKERLLDLYQKGSIKLDDIEKRLECIRNKIAGVESNITLLNQEKESGWKQLQLIDDFQNFSRKLGHRLKELTLTEKAQIVRLLVTEVAVDRKMEKITIKHVLPTHAKNSYELNARSQHTTPSD
jgi:site-specific DNA recombinase